MSVDIKPVEYVEIRMDELVPRHKAGGLGGLHRPRPFAHPSLCYLGYFAMRSPRGVVPRVPVGVSMECHKRTQSEWTKG